MLNLGKELGIRSAIIEYTGRVLRFRFIGEKEFKYYKIIGATSRYLNVSANTVQATDMVHIHCLDMADNEECYILITQIVEVRENNLKEFE